MLLLHSCPVSLLSTLLLCSPDFSGSEAQKKCHCKTLKYGEPGSWKLFFLSVLLSSQQYCHTIPAKHGNWHNIPSSHFFIHLLKLVFLYATVAPLLSYLCSSNLRGNWKHHLSYQEVSLFGRISLFACNFYLLLETMFYNIFCWSFSVLNDGDRRLLCCSWVK